MTHGRRGDPLWTWRSYLAEPDSRRLLSLPDYHDVHDVLVWFVGHFAGAPDSFVRMSFTSPKILDRTRASIEGIRAYHRGDRKCPHCGKPISLEETDLEALQSLLNCTRRALLVDCVKRQLVTIVSRSPWVVTVAESERFSLNA